jgi:hypothetical protein
MPLQKILFKPGVNRENTRYTTEGGWYECDKIRFRQGTPETIGGWKRISPFTFLGICRSLWNWVTLGALNLLGVGTNLKFYIERGGAYFDITPLRSTVVLNGPFTAVTIAPYSSTITVTDAAHDCVTGDFVTFSGALTLGGNITAAVLNQEYQITVTGVNTYTFTAKNPTTGVAVTSNASDTGHGGTTVTAAYQLNVGPSVVVPLVGWGAGAWGSGPWGTGGSSITPLRLWNQTNYGEDLIFGPRGGGIYYWDATLGLATRGVLLSSLGGTVTFTSASPTVVTLTVGLTEGAAVQFAATTALPTGITAGITYYVYQVSGLTCNLTDANGNLINTSSTGTGVYISNLVDVPLFQDCLTVSDTSRFIIAFGTNDYGTTVKDPMMIRWSNQDDPYNWTPTATNQAGNIRLSHGSEIITTVQTRQEIVVITDSSVYSMQYLGPPYVWGVQLLGDNISIISPNAAISASGIVYWMGVDKFYAYDGRIQTLNCDLRRFVFQDPVYGINQAQQAQVFCGTNEGFNEVWWFYPSVNSVTVDRYVVYNYIERAWYYGSMARTAWLDSGLREYPMAATYQPSSTGNIVSHELGLNSNTDGTDVAINAYISSSEFDIGEGHNFGFVWRMLPDLTFQNSENAPNSTPPQLTLTLQGLANSGSGVTSSAAANVSSSSTYVITEEFTGELFTRLRGRQMIFKIESNQLNTAWQIGAPRMDIRQDGRR